MAVGKVVANLVVIGMVSRRLPFCCPSRFRYSALNKFGYNIYPFQLPYSIKTSFWCILNSYKKDSDSDSDRGLFNQKIHMEVLHQVYITELYEHFEQIWTWHNQNACWETSTKIIADRFHRGHPEGGGVLRSIVGIYVKESAAGYIAGGLVMTIH